MGVNEAQAHARCMARYCPSCTACSHNPAGTHLRHSSLRCILIYLRQTRSLSLDITVQLRLLLSLLQTSEKKINSLNEKFNFEIITIDGKDSIWYPFPAQLVMRSVCLHWPSGGEINSDVSTRSQLSSSGNRKNNYRDKLKYLVIICCTTLNPKLQTVVFFPRGRGNVADKRSCIHKIFKSNKHNFSGFLMK